MMLLKKFLKLFVVLFDFKKKEKRISGNYFKSVKSRLAVKFKANGSSELHFNDCASVLLWNFNTKLNLILNIWLTRRGHTIEP